MTDNITIRPQALREIEEAWWWYEGQREGLGDDFVLCDFYLPKTNLPG